MADEKIRVGVVGCGTVGSIHAEGYREHPNVELVGMCDTNSERLNSACIKLSVPGYPTLSEMIEKGKPDLVSMVLPIDKFVEPIREAIQAGVHVVSEKPVSFDPEDIAGLIALAEKNNVQFGVNFNQRYTKASRWFKRLREEGEFGDMLYVTGLYNQGPMAVGNFGSLREYMIHYLDLWQFHAGRIVSVTAQAAYGRGNVVADKPDGVAVTLKFENGALGSFTNGFPAVGGVFSYYELVGTKGRGSCENFVGRAIFRPNGGPAQFIDPPWLEKGANYWDSFIVHFHEAVDALIEGRPLPVQAEAALDVQLVCDAIAESIKTGKCVEVVRSI